MAVSANVSTETLGEDDLYDILDDLKDVTAQCYQIGTRLRLKNSALTLFRAEKLTHPEALERIINEWLSKNYNVERFGPPTWKALVEAVAHPGGGNHKALAMEIAKRHQAGVSAPPSKTDYSAPPQATPPQSAPMPSPSEGLPQPIVGAKDPNFFQEAFNNKTEADGGGNKKVPFTRYEPQPKGAIGDIKFSFGTVSAQGGEKRSIAGSYSMSCWPHGMAVIINNERFQRQRDREGTQIDEKNLVQILRYLGYRVDVYQNCSAQAILDIMGEYQRHDHWSHDSFICCILSHGKMGQIYGSDSLMVPLDDITDKLNGDSCKSLASKPKMFFMQACRGTLKDKGVHVEADDDEMEEEQRVLCPSGASRVVTDDDSKIPSAKDFYFGYATAGGHVAWRDLDNGSWYISELCRSLASYAQFASLSDMMTITNRRVGTVYTNAEYKQSTEATTRLGSDVFFF